MCGPLRPHHTGSYAGAYALARRSLGPLRQQVTRPEKSARECSTQGRSASKQCCKQAEARSGTSCRARRFTCPVGVVPAIMQQACKQHRTKYIMSSSHSSYNRVQAEKSPASYGGRRSDPPQQVAAARTGGGKRRKTSASYCLGFRQWPLNSGASR